MTKRWYCVHVKAGKEAAAAVEIAALGFPVFIPMYTVYRREGSRQVPIGNKPLFPRYIFTAFDVRRRFGYGTINRCRTVSKQGVLSDIDGKPCAIPYRIMRAIRERDKRRERGPKKVSIPYKKNQPVRIINGPFAGFDAMFEGPAGQRVAAFLSIFGRETRVVLEIEDLRAAG